MRAAAAWVVAVSMIVAAWWIAGATPDGEQRMLDPFPVRATWGQTVEADNLGVTVHGARLADRVATGGWSADGRWLVVDLDAWIVRREPAALGLAYLLVGDRTFLASERVADYDADASLGGWGLHAGIPQTGTLVFELPEDITDDPAAADAVLQLALGRPLAGRSPQQNQQGGTVVEIPVDLTAVAHQDLIDLGTTTWTDDPDGASS